MARGSRFYRTKKQSCLQNSKAHDLVRRICIPYPAGFGSQNFKFLGFMGSLSVMGIQKFREFRNMVAWTICGNLALKIEAGGGQRSVSWGFD
jgi:hypothetical protein